MLQLCILLLIVGMGAILLELIMPGYDGYIGGVLGVLAIIASAVLAVLFLPGGWFFVGISATIVFAGVFLVVRFVRRRQGRIFLTETLAKDVPTVDLESLLGSEGKTVSLLRPYGEADFNGIRVEVSSGGAMIDRGKKIRVVDVQANKVLVSLVDGN